MINKNIDLIWAVSLIVGAVITFIGVFGGDIGMPDVVRRIIGVVGLINLAVLAYASVIKIKNGRKK